MMSGKSKPLSVGFFREISANGTSTETDKLISYQPDRHSDLSVAIFEREDLLRTLSQTINLLPFEERLVVSLYYVTDLTTEEIGDVMQMEAFEVWKHLERAILKLRMSLKQQRHSA